MPVSEPTVLVKEKNLETHSRFVIRILFVAIALGLGWAVRGHFGHEWGAAWAGGIGVLAVLIAAGRIDWYRRLPVIVIIGAVGWGVGGMMSYGIVVGYGRGDEFFNVLYGLSMLGLIGGLYGFMGGGFLGCALATSDAKPIDWAALLTQMVAGAMLSWGLLIYQLEWFMTPPRSELWAACLGAVIAMAWYLYREGFSNALRVACCAALGAGFGFAFGNFLQVMGNVSGIPFNWWNVMEFSLGFFGGLGMAYGVLGTIWPAGATPSKAANKLGLFALLIALPATNLIQAFEASRFQEMATNLGLADPASFVQNQFLLGWGMLLVVAGFIYWSWQRKSYALMFFAFAGLYIFEAHIRKGFFVGAGGVQLEQFLYWANLVVLGLILWSGKLTHLDSERFTKEESLAALLKWLLGIGLALIVLALVAIQLHDGLPGAHNRF